MWILERYNSYFRKKCEANYLDIKNDIDIIDLKKTSIFYIFYKQLKKHICKSFIFFLLFQVSQVSIKRCRFSSRIFLCIRYISMYMVEK